MFKKSVDSVVRKLNKMAKELDEVIAHHANKEAANLEQAAEAKQLAAEHAEEVSRAERVKENISELVA